jgi:flavin-dependent dehydrogenase
MQDLIVVGGGPAGLATAIFAARSGLAVTLVERKRFPVDKPCGEGLMPRGVRLLQEMGVEISPSRAFEGIRYVTAAAVADARIRQGQGLGIRRTVLSHAMARRAIELGVELRDRLRATKVEEAGDRVRVETSEGELEARWLAAADGLGSGLRQDLGRQPRPERRREPRFGYRRHYRVRPWSSFVEVYWAEGGEAYVTPVAADEVGIALLWHRAAPSFEAMLSRFPILEQRLDGAPATTAVAGAGPFRRRIDRIAGGRVALVGDASGYVDALTGEGVSLAFECAKALSVSLCRGDLASYASEHRRLSRRYRIMAELVLCLSRHPRIRERVVAHLASHPELFERFLAIADDRAPWSSLLFQGADRRPLPASVIK